MGIFTNAGISGIVRWPDGKPAANVKVDLIDVDPGYAPPPIAPEQIETGAHGEFSLTGLPSGRFLLGVNIENSSDYPDQTPPTYFPGVAAPKDAHVIELTPNQVKKGLVLTLLPARAFRTVRVHLRWPDGSIPNRGTIEAWLHKGIYSTSYDLAQGTFELNLLQGVEYWLTAAALDESRKRTPFAGGTWVYADNYLLAAGDGSVDITLTAHFEEPQWSKAMYPRIKPAE